MWKMTTIDGDHNGTNYRYSPRIAITDNDDRHVATVHLVAAKEYGLPETQNHKQIYNARLITAAPGLLHALQRMTHPMADDTDLAYALDVIAQATKQEATSS